MHKQLAYPGRLDVIAITLLVRAYMHIIQVKLATINAGKAVVDINAVQAYRLDFGAFQLNAGLKSLKYFIIPSGLVVCRKYGTALVRFTHLGRHYVCLSTCVSPYH